MSAFMVKDKTINTIVSFLADSQFARNHRGWMNYHFNLDLSKDEAREALGKKLFQMNIDGVNARYGEGRAEEFRKLDYRYKFNPSLTAISAFKALQCFLYQCSEGEVDKTELYQTMNQISGAIAESIVCDLPQYESAPWG
jgi:hypothetical protein